MRLNSRALLVSVVLVMAVLKAWLAWRLPLFGDEAFYWLESRHPALGYSDVPPLGPWLIALGGLVLPDTVFGVRWPALLLGLSLPLWVFAWARRFVGDADARAAALLSLLLPLGSSLGVLAPPDVPLTVAAMLAAITLSNAMVSNRWRDWIAFGLALAMCALAHYRFALLLVGAAGFVLGMPRGRALLREPRFWGAAAIGALGLVPTLVFNLQHGWAGLRFQFVDRHPWAFDSRALNEPLVQAAIATPALAVLIVAAIVRAWRRRHRVDAPYDLLAGCAGGLLLLQLVGGLFFDAERVRFHWTLPAILLALPLVPDLLRDWRDAVGRGAIWRRATALLAVPLAVAGTLALFAVLVLATRPADGALVAPVRPMPDNLQGWHEVGRWAAGLAAAHPTRTVISDHFMGAAQIDFALRDPRPVFALDHPLNAKHGRVVQLAILRRDEAALAASGWREGLLFVEETARREIDRVPAALALCGRFGSLRQLDELVLFGGRWRWLAYAVTPPVAGRAAAPCELPAMADWTAPLPDAARVGEPLALRGWAMADFIGVREVDVLLDGVPRARANYGEDFAGVRGQWPMSADPNHPAVGFSATLALRPDDAGVRLLALRVTTTDGRQRLLGQRRLSIGAGR
jgi:4-amino-4-deoxy-L-arabinose transferase-like glycosyltransferase